MVPVPLRRENNVTSICQLNNTVTQYHASAKTMAKHMPLFVSRVDGESPFIDWVGGNEQKIEIARSRKQTKYNSPEKVE
jgi:hypothetical protein